MSVTEALCHGCIALAVLVPVQSTFASDTAAFCHRGGHAALVAPASNESRASAAGEPGPGTLVFSSREGGSNLKALYEFVRTSLTPSESDSWKCPVLLVDDVSVLLSLGMRPVDVLDFIHYCRATVCSQLKVWPGFSAPPAHN